MIECNINNITKFYGADLIFEDISFDIKTNERIGLIGPNGCGKTTIMKIIIGIEHVQNGNVTFRKGTKLGYLDQIPEYGDDVKVIDIMQSAFVDVYRVKSKLDQCTLSLGKLTGDLLERALNEYTILNHDFEQLDGYLVETNINKVCSGLKISDAMKEMNFKDLNGK